MLMYINLKNLYYVFFTVFSPRSASYGRLNRAIPAAAFEFDREQLFASGSRTMGLQGRTGAVSYQARSVEQGLGDDGGEQGAVVSARAGLSSRFT